MPEMLSGEWVWSQWLHEYVWMGSGPPVGQPPPTDFEFWPEPELEGLPPYQPPPTDNFLQLFGDLPAQEPYTGPPPPSSSGVNFGAPSSSGGSGSIPQGEAGPRPSGNTPVTPRPPQPLDASDLDWQVVIDPPEPPPPVPEIGIVGGEPMIVPEEPVFPGMRPIVPVEPIIEPLPEPIIPRPPQLPPPKPPVVEAPPPKPPVPKPPGLEPVVPEGPIELGPLAVMVWPIIAEQFPGYVNPAQDPAHPPLPHDPAIIGTPRPRPLGTPPPDLASDVGLGLWNLVYNPLLQLSPLAGNSDINGYMQAPPGADSPSDPLNPNNWPGLLGLTSPPPPDPTVGQPIIDFRPARQLQQGGPTKF